jgi:hypothetical protein
MKVIYRDCEIEVTKEKCTAGYDMIFYSIFNEDGLELASSFSDSDETIYDFMEDLKFIVDDYRDNPWEYEEE